MSAESKKHFQHFRKEWLKNDSYKDWLMPVEGDSTRCNCRYCKRPFNAKIYDIDRHLNTMKHQKAAEIAGKCPTVAEDLDDDVSRNTKKSHFHTEWLEQEKYKNWLLEVESDETKCFCKYCKCLMNAKLFEIERHVKTGKHQRNASLIEQSYKISKKGALCFICKDDIEEYLDSSFQFSNNDVLHQIVSEILNVDIKVDIQLQEHICTPCLSQVDDYYTLQSQLDALRNSLQESYQKGKLRLDGDQMELALVKSETSPMYVLYQDDNSILIKEINEEDNEVEDTEQYEEVLLDSSEELHITRIFDEDDQSYESQKKTESTNISHTERKSTERIYICDFCEKAFTTKTILFKHLQIHLLRERNFKCNICEKSFYTASNLQCHVKSHSKEYECAECGKKCGSKGHLEQHLGSHRKSFVCRFCGKPFGTRAEIKNHERLHTGEKPFKCDQCPKAFAQRSNLHSHLRTTHLNDRKHKCELCDRAFKRRRLLTYHMQAVHTGERPHQCKICNAAFVYPEHFKKHLRTHTGEKPFICEICKRPFSSRENLKPHLFVHSQDKKLYECSVCNAGFMRKPLLITHMKNQEHVSDYMIMNHPKIINETLEIESVMVTLGSNEDDQIIMYEYKS